MDLQRLSSLGRGDYEGHRTAYDYDGAGRLIRENKGKATTLISYDSLGRPAVKREEISSGTDRTTLSVYDVLDRLVEERVEEDDGTVRRRVNYTYDSRGNCTSTSIHTDSGVSLTETEYNTRNLPVKVTSPDGFSTHYVYHDSYRNALGREVECIEEIDPQGVSKKKVMDALGRLSSEEILSPLGELLHETTYSYDGVGNMCKREDNIFSEGKLLRTVACEFSYDVMGRQTAIIEACGAPEQRITNKAYTPTGQILCHGAHSNFVGYAASFISSPL